MSRAHHSTVERLPASDQADEPQPAVPQREVGPLVLLRLRNAPPQHHLHVDAQPSSTPSPPEHVRGPVLTPHRTLTDRPPHADRPHDLNRSVFLSLSLKSSTVKIVFFCVLPFTYLFLRACSNILIFLKYLCSYPPGPSGRLRAMCPNRPMSSEEIVASHLPKASEISIAITVRVRMWRLG